MVAIIIAYYNGAKPYMTYMMTCVPLAYLRGTGVGEVEKFLNCAG